MKKYFSLILLALLPIVANADNIKIGDLFYSFSGDNATVTYTYYPYTYSGTVVIPESVAYNGKTYSVTSIDNEAFRDCSGLTSITIGSNVTSIGSAAFENCSSLTSINIPNSVTSIGSFAFDDCSGLTSITIGSNVTSIGDFAFSDCSGLTSVTIPNSVTSIGNYAFVGCSGLTSITIPNSMTSIGEGVFSGCSGLTSVTIPNSVTSIGERAFYQCSGLTSINIPNSVTSIGYYAFDNCSGLTDVSIGSGVTSIGNYAFSGCSNINTLNLDYENIGTEFSACRGSLQTLTLGDNVASIGYQVFYQCTGLTDVTIGSGVTSIGEQAFCQCTGLTDVTIGSGVTSIGGSAFSGCSGLTSVTIPNSVTSIGGSAFYNCSGLTSVTIGSGVTSIGGYAFSSCSGLTSVTIPSSVTSIGNNAFNCSNLVKAEFASMEGLCGISFADLSSNPMYYAKQKNLYIDGREVTDVVIPNSAKNISQYAFAYCTNLTSITVESGNSVYDSRDNCNAIIETATGKLIAGCMNTVIPGTVTGINDYAFYSCTGLTSLTIPSSVTSIGTYAFRGCKLRNILIKGATPPTSFINSFSEQSFYHTTLYIPTDSWDAYAYDNAWYKFINIRETATAGEQVSLQQAYMLMDAETFAYFVYDPVSDGIVSISSSSNIDGDNPNHSWLAEQIDGQMCLYNVGAGKFAVPTSDGSLTLSSAPAIIEVENGEGGILFDGKTEHQWAFVCNDRMNAEAIITGIKDSKDLKDFKDFVDSWHSLDGRRLSAPQKGINIVRYSDGTTRKVLVK